MCDTLCAVAQLDLLFFLNFSFLAELLRKICKSIFAYFVANIDPILEIRHNEWAS